MQAYDLGDPSGDEDAEWSEGDTGEGDAAAAAAALPPRLTLGELVRQLSEEGRRLLVKGLDSPVAAAGGAAAASAAAAGAGAPPSAPLATSLPAVEAELEDVKSVFGGASTGRVSTRADGSVEVTVRLGGAEGSGGGGSSASISLTLNLPPEYPMRAPVVSLRCPRLAPATLRTLEVSMCVCVGGGGGVRVCACVIVAGGVEEAVIQFPAMVLRMSS